MKKVIVLFALSSLPLVVAQAQNDSIRSESLPEVVVTADVGDWVVAKHFVPCEVKIKS